MNRVEECVCNSDDGEAAFMRGADLVGSPERDEHVGVRYGERAADVRAGDQVEDNLARLTGSG